jgi:hypothetical protein
MQAGRWRAQGLRRRRNVLREKEALAHGHQATRFSGYGEFVGIRFCMLRSGFVLSFYAFA